MDFDTVITNMKATKPGFAEVWDDMRAARSLLHQLVLARQRAGLTQRELASRVGMDQSSLGRLEAGATLPNLKTISKLLTALDYDIRLIPMEEPPKVDALASCWDILDSGV